MKRSAFTMLELIVTIVVLALAFSAIPMMLTQNSKDLESTIEQEALYAASAKLSQMLTYKWDERSSVTSNSIATTTAKVLDIPASASTDTELARLPATRFRAGHFQVSGRRNFFSSETNASLLGNDLDDNVSGVDDIDDPISATLVSADTEDGYKASYQVTETTNYINDVTNYAQTNIKNEINLIAANRSNIKKIDIAVSMQYPGSNSFSYLFSLVSFSSNIGETPVASRVYP